MSNGILSRWYARWLKSHNSVLSSCRMLTILIKIMGSFSNTLSLLLQRLRISFRQNRWELYDEQVGFRIWRSFSNQNISALAWRKIYLRLEDNVLNSRINFLIHNIGLIWQILEVLIMTSNDLNHHLLESIWGRGPDAVSKYRIRKQKALWQALRKYRSFPFTIFFTYHNITLRINKPCFGIHWKAARSLKDPHFADPTPDWWNSSWI